VLAWAAEAFLRDMPRQMDFYTSTIQPKQVETRLKSLQISKNAIEVQESVVMTRRLDGAW
jgi:hypothetical protein